MRAEFRVISNLKIGKADLVFYFSFQFKKADLGPCWMLFRLNWGHDDQGKKILGVKKEPSEHQNEAKVGQERNKKPRSKMFQNLQSGISYRNIGMNGVFSPTGIDKTTC